MSDTTIDARGPLRRATFGDQLRRNALRHPDREAIVAYGVPGAAAGTERRSLTYAQLHERSNRLADSLARRGVGRGDVVAIMGRNTPELILAFWAATKLGAAVTGVNFTFTERELHYQISHSGAKAIVVEDEFHDRIDAISEPLPALELKVINDTFSATAPSSWLRLSELVEEGDPAEPQTEVDEDAIGVIPYTSGTTNLPKAVAIPQRNYFVSMIPSYVTGIGLIEEDVWYFTMPLHTIAGVGMQICLLSLGNKIVLPLQADPDQALRAIVDEGVTVIGQTPTFYLRLIQADGFADADLSRIRRCITYGGTIPRSIVDAIAAASPQMEWVTLWSQSEITQTPTIGRFRSLDEVPGGDASWIGRPTAQLEVRVVDEDGRDAEEGELICRTPGVMAGYFRDPERTAEVVRDDWLYTGDLVRIDGDGNLFFVDRRKDMIKTGGMNVSSVEVERILYEHDDVHEVAVVGLADEYWSQAVTAFLVPRPGAEVDTDELIAFCKERLAPYKVPKSIRVVEALPKDSQGKILKRELRQAPDPAST